MFFRSTGPGPGRGPNETESKSPGRFASLKSVVPYALSGLVVIIIASILFSVGVFRFPAPGSAIGNSVPAADAPPLQYIDLDSHQVLAYVGQLEDGLATTQARTQQLTQSINASIFAGTFGQLAGSQQRQVGTQETVTPTAADLFYMFMRLLRAGGEANCTVASTGPAAGRCNPGGCNGRSRTRWLGEVDAEWGDRRISNQVACIGVGNFVRIAHVQMFLPPFAQALTRAQSAQAVYGALPAQRTAFTSPTQSAQIRASLGDYQARVGPNPRLPFVAAPYGQTAPVGAGFTFFVPVDYSGLTTEPALLSGSVTVVGKIIYFAPGGQAYIDYPTISQFGQPLLKAKQAVLDAIGVCSSSPPVAARPKTVGPGPHGAGCSTPQRRLDAVKRSVTYKPPLAVVLPVAIYQ